LDDAISLFLVGETSADCLRKEADFALWTVHHPQRTWGLLAKALINVDDTTLRNAYIDEICSAKNRATDQEVCNIALTFRTGEGDELKDKIAIESKTGQVLQLEFLERSGKFSELQKRVEEFKPGRLKAALTGYFMRSLWAQHEMAKSRGALSTAVFADQSAAVGKWAGWSCLAEMESGCEMALKEPACQYFVRGGSKDVFVGSSNNPSIESILAELKVSHCTNRPLYLSSEEKAYAKTKTDLLRVVEILEAPYRVEKKAYELSQVVKRSHGIVQARALVEWARAVQSKKEIEEVYLALAKVKRHDELWQSTVLNLFQAAYKTRNFATGFKLSELLPAEVFRAWGFAQPLIVTLAKDDREQLGSKVH
jgi:hypothetical protein